MVCKSTFCQKTFCLVMKPQIFFIYILERISSLHDCMDCHWPLVLLKCSVTSLELRLYSNYICGSWLPQGRKAALNPEARVQLTSIESVISQDCQVGNACVVQDERKLIQCSSSASLFEIWAAPPLPPSLLCRPVVALSVLLLCQARVQGSSNSSEKLRSEHKREPTGTDCCGTSRLLQTRVDPRTACPRFYLPTLLCSSPDSSLWTKRMSWPCASLQHLSITASSYICIIKLEYLCYGFMELHFNPIIECCFFLYLLI